MTQPLTELVEQFCNFQRKQRGKTEGGVKSYRWNLEQFLVFIRNDARHSATRGLARARRQVTEAVEALDLQHDQDLQDGRTVLECPVGDRRPEVASTGRRHQCDLLVHAGIPVLEEHVARVQPADAVGHDVDSLTVPRRGSPAPAA
ncbi:MAG: hypothetical protein ACRD96_01120 [Bryobacteraceae bacterium]